MCMQFSCKSTGNVSCQPLVILCLPFQPFIVTTRPSTTMTLITVPTPTASSNQQLIEYILAVLVAVAVAIIILLGVRSISISHKDVINSYIPYTICTLITLLLQFVCCNLQVDKVKQSSGIKGQAELR